MAKVRRADDDTMSIDQAAHALEVKQQVAYQLARSDLLNSVPDTHAARWSDAWTWAFRQKYVSRAELATACATSPEAGCNRAKIQLVCGPRVNSAQQYFYRRCEAPPASVKLSIYSTATQAYKPRSDKKIEGVLLFAPCLRICETSVMINALPAYLLSLRKNTLNDLSFTLSALGSVRL